MSEKIAGITLLGQKETKYVLDYNPEVLEAFDNRHQNMITL